MIFQVERLEAKEIDVEIKEAKKAKEEADRIVRELDEKENELRKALEAKEEARRIEVSFIHFLFLLATRIVRIE